MICLLILQTLESSHPGDVPFFVETGTSVEETVTVQPEQYSSAVEISQSTENRPFSEPKSIFREHHPLEVVSESPSTTTQAKMEEKAKEHVILDPAHPQKLPHEDKPVFPFEDNNLVSENCDSNDSQLHRTSITEAELKTTHSSSECSPQDNGEAKCAKKAEITELFYGSVESVRPAGNAEKRFNVQKVEESALDQEQEIPMKSTAVDEKHDESTSLTKDNSASPKSVTEQKLSNESVQRGMLSRSDLLSPLEQMTDLRKQEFSDLHVGHKVLLAPSECQEEQRDFEVNHLRKNSDKLELVPSAIPSQWPECPTYGFQPVNDSVSQEQSLTTVESHLTSEELAKEEQKPECVWPSENVSTTIALIENTSAVLSKNEVVQGRFVVSSTSARPLTPCVDQNKPAVQTVEVTLQDFVTAGVTPSITPSSSLESLNSVGSQAGILSTHASSSSPQTTPPEVNTIVNQLVASCKEAGKKQIGLGEAPSEGVRSQTGKQDGDQGKLPSDQVW